MVRDDMPQYRRVLLHSNGPSFWPEQRSNQSVVKLKATTPADVWAATWMCAPRSAKGVIYQRSWWEGRNRYDPADPILLRTALRRWISVDTAGGGEGQFRQMQRQNSDAVDLEEAYTAMIVLELQPDYRLLVREVVREHLNFLDLIPSITNLARKWRVIDGGKTLAAVIIEAKSTGGPALQVLAAHADPWLAEMLWPYTPEGSKEDRARYTTTWCAKDTVLLPHPSPAVPWLFDFEEELFAFPGSQFADQVDSFSQGLWNLQSYLNEGLEARLAAEQQDDPPYIGAAYRPTPLLPVG